MTRTQQSLLALSIGFTFLFALVFVSIQSIQLVKANIVAEYIDENKAK